MKIQLKMVLFSLVVLTSCAKKQADFQDPLVTNRDTLVNPADETH